VHFAPQFLSGKAGASTCLADFIHCQMGESIMLEKFKDLVVGEIFSEHNRQFVKLDDDTAKACSPQRLSGLVVLFDADDIVEVG
jgi:hypothetical protein